MPAPANDRRRAAATLIDYHAGLGVDVAVTDMPADRFNEAPPPPQATLAEPTRAAPTPSAPAEATTAHTEADGAETLDELRAALETFDGCALKATATNLCFADGNPEARLMFVGEAPGRDEDLQGKPFVGRAGQLLDRILAAIDLDRTGCYIANTVYWRPPGNRNPNPEEMLACRPFIRRQIELMDPDVLVFLGGVAAKEMLETRDGILKLRGRWRTFDTGKRVVPAMATLHPAYLLRQPGQKKLAWKDFRAIRDKLAETAGTNGAATAS